MEFNTCALADLKDFRECYFTEINLPQELFLEWLVKEGRCYEIAEGGRPVGYFILSRDNILVEFHLANAYLNRKEELFKQVIERYSVVNAYCKSFDSLLLTCCHTYCKSSSIIGTIFRDYTDISAREQDNDMNIRLAGKDDIPFLLTFDSGLYETPEELEYTVSNKMVYLFEKEQQLVGCGYLINVLPNKRYYDIGMWTNPEFRQKGYAIQIIAYLKKHCLEREFIPICGCAADNIASRKTLEANGFISKHCIIDFKFN